MRVLAVLAAMIVPLAVYLPIYQERERAVERADEQIRKLETRIEQAHAAQQKLSQFHEEVARLNLEITKLRNILPPEPALEQVRNTIDSAAKDSGVAMERFQPKNIIKHEYVEVPIDTSAVGALHDLETFFGHLANKSRIINVTDVTLTKQSNGQWRSKFLMTTFALP
ncbi:MAG TPA: type 4a pilus biogenesis protein PilO [Thermoanaerobaculia bacterium]|nr:type 4a pilus biogenesis protein PilO [Thermoanaerobaculia bacterium]